MEQEKNNTFSWVLRFATQCKGKMTASVLVLCAGLYPILRFHRL